MTATSAMLPTAGGITVAVVASWGLLVVAGWAVAHRWLRGHHWLTTAALLPAVGSGSLVVWNELVQVAGLEVGPLGLVVWLAASAVIGRVVGRRQPPTGPETRPPAWLAAALSATAAVAVVLWVVAVSGPRLTPDQTDSTRHAFFVARIAQTGTNDPAQVLVEDPRSDEHSADYYPLTMHSTAAVVADVTGVVVPAALNGIVIAFMTAVLVPGLALVTIRLGGSPGASAGAALIGALTLPFPSVLYTWGFLPMIAALCVVPAAADAARRWLDNGDRHGALPLAVATLVGVYGLHNTEVISALALTAGLAVARTRRPTADAVTGPGGLPVRVLAGRVALLGLGCAAVLAADLVVFLAGTSERVDAGHQRTNDLWDLTVRLVTFGIEQPVAPLLLAAVATVGAVALVRSGRRAYVAVLAGVAALTLFSAVADTGWARLVTMPWYGFTFRIAATGYLLMGPLAGIGAAALARRVPRGPVVAGVAGLVVLPQLSTLWLRTIQPTSTIGEAELEAIEYLADRWQPGQAVLTETRDDGGLWLYTLAGIDPTFGFPVEYHEPGPQWAANTELLELVADPSAPTAELAALARQRCVAYVFAADHPALPVPGTLQRHQLRASQALEEVFTRDTVSIFRIRDADVDGCSVADPSPGTV